MGVGENCHCIAATDAHEAADDYDATVEYEDIQPKLVRQTYTGHFCVSFVILIQKRFFFLIFDPVFSLPEILTPLTVNILKNCPNAVFDSSKEAS